VGVAGGCGGVVSAGRSSLLAGCLAEAHFFGILGELPGVT